METIINILVFILILSLIIVIHELGHLIAAKKFGVYCSEFSIGMGPALLKWKKGETTWSLRAIPLGGYVQMAGEEGVELDVPHERTINGIKPWKQIVVMAAGAIMNVLLAYAVFTGLFMAQGVASVPSDPVISSVIENSPAATVGMQANDKIVKITMPDGSSYVPETFDDLGKALDHYQEGMLLFTVDRDGKQIDFKLTPQWNEDYQAYMIGVKAEGKVKNISWYEAFYYGGKELVDMTGQIMVGLGNLIRGVGLKDVSGPVGIYQATSQVANAGLIALVMWLGLLSLNVGIFNLIPIPILDGGRILIVLVEKAIGHKLSEKVQTAVMMAGLVLIIALMLFATANDIGRLF